MYRGCRQVMSQQWPAQLGSAFHGLAPASQFGILNERLDSAPVIPADAVKAARKSLEPLRLICDSPLEHEILKQLLSIVYALEKSSKFGT